MELLDLTNQIPLFGRVNLASDVSEIVNVEIVWPYPGMGDGIGKTLVQVSDISMPQVWWMNKYGKRD